MLPALAAQAQPWLNQQPDQDAAAAALHSLASTPAGEAPDAHSELVAGGQAARLGSLVLQVRVILIWLSGLACLEEQSRCQTTSALHALVSMPAIEVAGSQVAGLSNLVL